MAGQIREGVRCRGSNCKCVATASALARLARMKFGRKTDLLSPQEREIVDRFERGVIDAAEAGRLLIASVQHVDDAPVAAAEERAGQEEVIVDPNETPELHAREPSESRCGRHALAVAAATADAFRDLPRYGRASERGDSACVESRLRTSAGRRIRTSEG